MKSMSAYAELNRGSLRMSLRSVNSKGLEIFLRLPPPLAALELEIRNWLRERIQRGKLDVGLDLKGDPALELKLNRSLLRSVAAEWAEEAHSLGLPPLDPGSFFRVPGAWLNAEEDLAARFRDPVFQALQELFRDWDAGREREAQRLEPFFHQSLERLLQLRHALEEEARAHALELPSHYRQRLEQILQEAQLTGQIPEERVLAEAAILADRSDVREELVRLEAHLQDFQEKLQKRSLSGKALDIWAQEVLRELNTTGSKCKRLSMTRAVMEAKQVLEQLREQGANLE